MASLVPYPAHVAPPDEVQQELLVAAYRTALRHDHATWCPVYMLSGLGVLFGVPGAPRCPLALAESVGIGAVLSSQY